MLFHKKKLYDKLFSAKKPVIPFLKRVMNLQIYWILIFTGVYFISRMDINEIFVLHENNISLQPFNDNQLF